MAKLTIKQKKERSEMIFYAFVSAYIAPLFVYPVLMIWFFLIDQSNYTDAAIIAGIFIAASLYVVIGLPVYFGLRRNFGQTNIGIYAYIGAVLSLLFGLSIGHVNPTEVWLFLACGAAVGLGGSMFLNLSLKHQYPTR